MEFVREEARRFYFKIVCLRRESSRKTEGINNQDRKEDKRQKEEVHKLC